MKKRRKWLQINQNICLKCDDAHKNLTIIDEENPQVWLTHGFLLTSYCNALGKEEVA